MYLPSKIADFSLDKIIKWPLAVILIFFYLDIFYYFLGSFVNFFIGASWTYLIGAILFVFQSIRYGDKFLTFEHELTHAIFAFLTFKKDIKININNPTPDALGHCTFTGGDNWLIYLSPYFFPTLTVFLALLYLIVSDGFFIILDICIGYSLTYHLRTNFSELLVNYKSGPNSDINKVGKIYSIIIIPAMNFLIFSQIFNLLSR